MPVEYEWILSCALILKFAKLEIIISELDPSIYFRMLYPDLSPRDFSLSKAKVKWRRKRT